MLLGLTAGHLREQVEFGAFETDTSIVASQAYPSVDSRSLLFNANIRRLLVARCCLNALPLGATA